MPWPAHEHEEAQAISARAGGTARVGPLSVGLREGLNVNVVSGKGSPIWVRTKLVLEKSPQGSKIWILYSGGSEVWILGSIFGEVASMRSFENFGVIFNVEISVEATSTSANL